MQEAISFAKLLTVRICLICLTCKGMQKTREGEFWPSACAMFHIWTSCRVIMGSAHMKNDIQNEPNLWNACVRILLVGCQKPDRC